MKQTWHSPVQSQLKGTLYSPHFEQDSCGFGLIAQLDNQPSHWIVQTAISSLAQLTHRGAVSADGKSGDGCGLLFKKPDAFLRAVAAEQGWSLSERYAAGLVFFQADATLDTLTATLTAEGLPVLGFRVVPVDESACGEQALASLPRIVQVFVNCPAEMDSTRFARHLYMGRRAAEKSLKGVDAAFYVPTLSPDTILYKGLVTPDNLPMFYLDLQDARFESSLAVFHQRFSTNTWPQWKLAQPFRFLAHNGEINTVSGNRHWARAREAIMTSTVLNMETVKPIVQTDGSDSMSMDNMLEGLLMGGIPLFRALRMMVPPAWHNADMTDKDLKAFYEFNSMHMEPWDGPAGIVLTDGRYAACLLDRNGLRPARWSVTSDNILTIASEVGVWPVDPAKVVRKGRVKPGQLFAADLTTGEVLMPEDIDAKLKSAQPYRQWIKESAKVLELSINDDASLSEMSESRLLTCQKMFSMSREERESLIKVLATEGQEAVGSMGDDTPMAVLSQKVRAPYDYLRQQFAQVTNPPIDPIREAVVMSLNTNFGSERNLFVEHPDHALRLSVRSPILSRDKFIHITSRSEAFLKSTVLDLCYDPSEKTLTAALADLCRYAIELVQDGSVILVLTDSLFTEKRVAIPALFATGAVHHALIDAGLRCKSNIVVKTGSARDTHQMACLIGLGATAIYPYLAYHTVADLVAKKELVDAKNQPLPLNGALQAYRRGINKGLLKVLSKMGISTIASYRGAQLFEGVGLHEEIVDVCFKGMVSRLSGANFTDFEEDQLLLQKSAFKATHGLTVGGLLKYVQGGEYHMYNPGVVMLLQQAVNSGDYAQYQLYADAVNERPISTLRDLMRPKWASKKLALDEVESVESLLKRFDSAGMSLGALSPEAHETLAIAMNRLGGRSNSGEGGEAAARYGTEKMSKIKQIASGRFGVTPHYLVNAEVLQIKVAQGAKPGEGGQLPGDKVSPLIATLRHAKAGTSLISPPPHHDIYSIEDLAQLIFDLKQVNPTALVSVKLVSEPGVGTIAAGVAKSYADLITISGYDGGTGASPLSSVKHAGSPWELGVSEAQQTLRANGLRGRVRLQADGGLKTGLDVIKAALLGAESFGFGTGPMIALGCKYLRICHLNNCATGVATQDRKLIAKSFVSLPERVMNYFTFVAQETRQLLADMGVKTLEELVGRMDLLELIEGNTPRQSRLQLAPLLSQGTVPDSVTRHCNTERNPSFDKGELAEQMLVDAKTAIDQAQPLQLTYRIQNVHRSIGARLSGEIARVHGAQGLPAGSLQVHFEGSAGQSFGVWNASGLNLSLEGEANDYVAKGMAGGQVVIYPPKVASYQANLSVIVGNTCLYGATGGALYVAGVAGERFAVRNSGALAVVEGAGDHCCEYMTGGTVIVLGDTGHNFGAGMTGGFAFVYDTSEKFAYCYNNELIDIHLINNEFTGAYRAYLLEKLAEHAKLTGSVLALAMLADFDEYVDHFWLVKPKATTLESLLKD